MCHSFDLIIVVEHGMSTVNVKYKKEIETL